MDPQSSAARPWRLTALAGVFVIALGTTVFYIDVASHFRFDFIEHHYDAFGTGILVGVVCAFTGFIGWARWCSRQHRAMMAALVFIAPLAALLVGSPTGGPNVHRPRATQLQLP